MAFDHLRDAASECFERAREWRESKPESAMASEAFGHEIMASYLAANSLPGHRPEVEALLRIEQARYAAYGESIRPLSQHKYLLLALAIGDVKTSLSIAALAIDRKNWATFDSTLVFRVCEILGIPQEAKLPRARPSVTEQVFLDALDCVAEKRPYDKEKIVKFWRTLRKKRYQLTIFEHIDPFVPALETLSAV